MDLLDLHHVRHVDRIVDLDLLPVGERHLVDHRRRGRDQVEVEFALQPLLDDLEVQQPEKAAAEAEAQRRRGLHLVGEARVVEAQLAHGGAQILELRGVDREQAAEHHRNGGAETRQCRGCRLAVVRDGVADASVRHLLDGGGEEADLAGAELGGLLQFGREHADAVDVVARMGAHHADALAFLQGAVDDAHQHHHAEIEIVPAVDQQRLEGRAAVALGRRQAGDDRLQHGLDVEPGLGRDQDGVGGVEPDHVLDLLPDLVGLGGRQIDLVEDRHDLVVVVERLVDVGEGLRFDALARVHHQQRALAGREAAVDLVGEVDVPGRVDQVENVVLAVMGVVVQPHRLGLDGDAALALDIHGIEHLLAARHLALREAAGDLDQPVRKGRLAMVDMGNDREVADVVDGYRGHGPHVAMPGPRWKRQGEAAGKRIPATPPYCGFASHWAQFRGSRKS